LLREAVGFGDDAGADPIVEGFSGAVRTDVCPDFFRPADLLR
jgi:hypothetical protein